MKTIVFIIVGIVLIIGGVWTFFSARKWLHNTQKSGTNNGFALMGIGSGFIFGVLIFGLGAGYLSQGIMLLLK